MNRLRWFVIVAMTGSIIALCQSPSGAMPALARKYGFNCGMCHVAWPRLNDFGQKYRANGYRIPGQENIEQTILDVPGAPLAFRTQAGYTSDSFSPGTAGDKVNQFQLNGLDILGAGLLGENAGFFLGYLPRIDGGSGVEAQDASLEQANVIFSGLGSTWLNARLGKFEGQYVPFSALRKITISPYEVYEFDGSSGSLNRFSLANPATGVELTGWGRSPLQYALGFVNGSSSNDSSDSPADIYVRGAYVFGQGFGQTAGHRLGALAYFGRAEPDGGGARHNFNRYGLDAALNFSEYNVDIQYLQGRDSSGFNIAAPGDTYTFSGGFVQFNHFAMESAQFARFDWVKTPSADNHDVSRITVGWRQHLAHPLMLQIEYSHRKVDNGVGPGSDLTENFAAARVDWAF
ncbi:MAG: hypothetical protein KBC96_13190 [Armatimonadetes bacterium]|nr:hypothetical protein [Armatimonadota bacterium]